jgi:hypothetical protein
MTVLELPPEVAAVVQNFLTCEFTTLGKGGVPIAWPTLPIYWAERGLFVIASPAALSQKAANVRRNPRVSLLYSNPAGSGLARPPAVLVQGDACSPDEVLTGTTGVDPGLVAAFVAQGLRLTRTQPGTRLYLANPLTRYVMGWYFIRVIIYVTPRRITWWPGGDFDSPPHVLEASDVGIVGADLYVPA